MESDFIFLTTDFSQNYTEILNRLRRITKSDEFVKSRIHQMFGVSCLVFDMKYMMQYRYVIILNTKYQIQNTLVKSNFLMLFFIRAFSVLFRG